jgi:hypothetical protein
MELEKSTPEVTDRKIQYKEYKVLKSDRSPELAYVSKENLFLFIKAAFNHDEEISHNKFIGNFLIYLNISPKIQKKNILLSLDFFEEEWGGSNYSYVAQSVVAQTIDGRNVGDGEFTPTYLLIPGEARRGRAIKEKGLIFAFGSAGYSQSSSRRISKSILHALQQEADKNFRESLVAQEKGDIVLSLDQEKFLETPLWEIDILREVNPLWDELENFLGKNREEVLVTPVKELFRFTEEDLQKSGKFLFWIQEAAKNQGLSLV